MPQHIGIVGCSAPGAALCYETICTEAPEPCPEVSMHTHPFDQYNQRCLNLECGGKVLRDAALASD